MILSIVIVSWNTRDLLRRCLASVAAEADGFRPDGVETVVVDNGSTDGSAAMVRTDFPGTRLLTNLENVGFARANNQGIRVARGAYLLLLNPHTEIFPGALRALVDFLESEPRAGAAGACLVNPDGSLQPSAYPAPALSRELWRLLHLDALLARSKYPLTAWAASPPRPVEVVQGAALLLRRAALDDIGLLDEDYFMYTEEVDVCFRLARAGWLIYWVPQARVLHHGGQSTRQVAAEMFLRLYESKVVFFRKHYGRRTTFLYKVLLLLVSLPRIALGWMQPGTQGRALSANYLRLVKALPGF
jgi:GT2 family glycosyltransferase